jgi:hypothetical protein
MKATVTLRVFFSTMFICLLSSLERKYIIVGERDNQQKITCREEVEKVNY